MSRNRKNFHYHYAEQFETRAEKIAHRRRAARRSTPPLALIVSLVLLVMFGFITTTFSVFVSSSDDAATYSGNSLAAQAQNHAIWREMQIASRANTSSFRSDTPAVVEDNSNTNETTAPAAAEDDAAPVIKRGVLELAETGTMNGEVLYVQITGSNWKSGGARFAVYFYQNSNTSNNTWKSLTRIGTTDVYYLNLPTGAYDRLIICRMNGSTTANNWDNKWNQSGDITYGTDNYYYQNDNEWDGHFTATSVSFLLYDYSAADNYSMTYSSGTSYTYTYSNFVAAATSYSYKAHCGNEWYPSAEATKKTESGFVVGATYDITVTFDYGAIKQDSNATGLSVSKTQKTWSVTPSIAAASTGMGTISESGAFFAGTSGNNLGVELTATPVLGYRFVNWTVAGGANVSDASAATTTVYASATGTVTANFEESPECTIGVSTSSVSLDLGDVSSAITVSALHHGSGDITVTSSDDDKVKVSTSSSGPWGDSVTLSGIKGDTNAIDTAPVYVKAFAPTSEAVVLTAACAASPAHYNTHSATISVSVSTPGISVDDISGVVIDSSDTFSPTLSNPSTQRGTVSYKRKEGSVGDATIALSGENHENYTAWYAGETEITATYSYSNNGVVYTATCDFTVTVAQPTLSLTALSVEEYKTANLTVASATPSPTSLTWTKTGGANVTLGTGTTSYVPVTAPAYDSSNATANIQVVANYVHTSATFTFSGEDAPVTVTESSVGFDYNYSGSNGNVWQKMVYDPTASSTLSNHDVYKVTLNSLPANSSYYFKIWAWYGTDHRAYTGSYTVTESHFLTSSSGITLNTTAANWPCVTTGNAGNYTFYFDKTNQKFYVIYPPDEYYIFGDFYVVNNNWGIHDDYKMDYDAVSGKYTKTINTRTDSRINRGSYYHIKLSRNGSSDWEKVYTANSSISSGVNNLDLIHAQTHDGIYMYIRANGIYTFTFTPGASPKLKIEYPDDEYYLFGSYDNWTNNANEDYIFTKSGNNYVLNYTVTDQSTLQKGQGYRIKISVNGCDNHSIAPYFTSEAEVSSTSSTVLNTAQNSQGLHFYVGAKGNYTFTFNPSNSTLQITYPADVYYLLVGSFVTNNNTVTWSPSYYYELEYDSTDEVWEKTIGVDENSQLRKGTEYGIKISKNCNTEISNHVFSATNFITSFGSFGKITETVTDVPMTANNTFDATPIIIGANGDYTVTFDPDTPQFSVEYPDDTYYLVGTFNTSGNNWLATDAYEFSEETASPGIWKCTFNTYTDSNFDVQQSYSIKISKNGDVTHNVHLYGYASADYTVSETTSNISLANDSVNNTWYDEIGFEIGAAGRYTFTLDLTSANAPKLSIDYPGKEYYLLGFGSTFWSIEDPKRILDDDDDDDGTFTYTLSTSGGVNSSIAKNTAYSGNNNGFAVYCNDGTYYYSSTGITADSASIASMSTSSSKRATNLTTKYSGDYVFSFTPSTKALAVTYPERNVSVTSVTSMNSVPFNTEVAGSHIASSDSGDDVFTYTLESNTHYQINNWKILKGGVDITSNLTGSGVAINAGSYAGAGSATAAFAITVTTDEIIEVQAVLQPIQYTVTIYTDQAVYDDFSTDGWSNPNTSTYTTSYYYGQSLTLPVEADFTQTNPWTWGGWYESSSYSGDQVTNVAQWTAENKEFWLRWTVHVLYQDNVRKLTVYQEDITHGTTPVPPTPDDTYFPDDIPGFERTTGWYNKAALNENTTVYRKYIPVAKEFVLDLTAYESRGGDGSQEDPFVFEVKFGVRVAGTATITDPESTYGTVYTWSLNPPGGNYSVGDTNTSYANDNMADTGSSINYASRNTVVLSSKAYYNDGLGGVTSSNISSKYFCYYINTPLSGMEFAPVQKIFAPNSNTATGIRVLFQEDPDAILNIATETVGDTATKKYQASLLYFDTSTKTFRSLNSSITDSIFNDITVGSGTNGFRSVFDSAFIGNELNETGVKYYDAKFWRYDAETSDYVEDSQWGTPIHTTVGTVSTAASQPLFVVNQLSAHSFYNEVNDEFDRVMAFYVNEQGGLGYQTARPFIRVGETDEEVYRFDIPSDVTEVVIGVFSSDPREKYVLPTLSSSGGVYSLTFDTDYFDYRTDWINLEQTVDATTCVRHVVKLTELGEEDNLIDGYTLADTLS